MMYLFRHCQPVQVDLPDNFSVDQYKRKLIDTILQNKLMTSLWQNTSPELQNKLIISYSYRQIYNQVLNIEIPNWHKLSFVESKFINLKNSFTFQKYRVIGNHRENIRFGNIHFATDVIDGKTVYQIHWDKYSPSNLINVLKHNIFD